MIDLCNINDIKGLLGRHGFNFSKSLGQNFLTASWVPERIALESGVGRGCGVLEIGPGVGCLTTQLAKYASKVVAVELDSHLIPVLDETLRHLNNVQVIRADIIKLDIAATISDCFHQMPVKVCANLPYNITSPVLTRLIESGLFESITVMIQKEVANRICAKPGTKDYGSFTVFANYYTEPSILFDVSPNCFIPRPKVTSTVINMKVRKEPPCVIENREHFFKVVRAAFGQRRKTLVNCLASVFGLPKPILEEILISRGFDSRIRGETLGIPEFAEISSVILKKAQEDIG